jgi:two-component system sensor histidine kinase TctE
LLRRQLLSWLLTPLFVLLTADTFLTYWISLSFSQRAYDRSLVEIAREVSLHLKGAEGRLVLDLPPPARRVLLSDPEDRVFLEVSTADGAVLEAAGMAPPRRIPARGATETFYDGEVDGAAVRIIQLNLEPDRASGRPGGIVRVAETENKRNALAREIVLSVVLPQLLLILIAGLVVWIGVVRGLAPLERVRRAVATRSHVDRSPVTIDRVPGEVGPLLQSINELLARLDQALTFQSRFISDAAHQLKTPIAVLQTQLEVGLREQDPARMRQVVEGLYPGLERLSRLVSQLLSLARNEPEVARSLEFSPLDLNQFALQVATAWVPEAMKHGIDLGFEGSDAAVTIRGDPGRLHEMLDNLLDNAVRYSRPGGRVTVRVGGAPARIEVSDDGPSIPGPERERVFERFHRLLGSPQGGSGLGLAIAEEIARLHGASITLRDDTDGVGNTFSVVFASEPAGQ